MKTFDEMEYHPDAEKLVEIISRRARNTNPLFFRVMVAYYFSVIASMMRCKIDTLDRGEIPVNLFAINLMPSGAGKGVATNAFEDEVIEQFQHTFTEETFQLLADQHLPMIANQRAIRKSADPDDELERTKKEFEALGALFFSFDSGTAPAAKDIRQKLLLANSGALNFQMDEIGRNLTANLELLATFLELYDVGKIKRKLVKSTADNKRYEEIKGRTPANMMLFGTPASLLDGSKTEEEFYALLEAGYARRCFFGYSRTHDKIKGMTPEEVLDQSTDTSSAAFMTSMSDKLGDLADMSQFDKKLQISRDVTLLVIEYQQHCEERSDRLGEHDAIRKAELSHRYFKVLKLAGAYAFIDASPMITEDHLYYAIKLAESSGEAFDKILTRDRPYVKLAKYLADVKRSVTQADLIEDLPFYKGNIQQKAEMLQLAATYGYQNNILIKKVYVDGIEFLRGETLERVDLDKMKVSYSTELAAGYKKDIAAFTDLHIMTQHKAIHWCTHYFTDDYRTEDNAIPGFSMIVLDIDEGIDMKTAMSLLEDYKAMFYTTKRHTATNNRFRIVLPMNFELSLDAKDYKEFMNNVFKWLPFVVDTKTGQRSRKWLSHPGQYVYQDGEVLDILPFIPKTSRNEAFKATVLDQEGMDNLERWVINNTGEGNRNEMLMRFSRILVDAGFDFNGVLNRVNALNDKLPDKLEEAEILGTIMVSVGKALASK